MKIEKISVDKLLLDPANARKHGKKNLDSIKGSLAKFGQQKPIVVNAENVVVAGNGTLQAAKELGWKEISIVRTDLKGSDITAFGIADNRTSELAEWDDDVLKELLEGLKAEDFDLSAIGFDDIEIGNESDLTAKNCSGSLAARFMIPPLSVLNVREGWWQSRKRAWLALGIKSEIGRDSASNALGATFKGSAQAATLSTNTGTSIFDPVLCELVYRWFSPADAVVLDPFAGGSVRGVVAGKLGRQYIGCELRQEQVDANREQAAAICADTIPTWHCADSINIHKTCEGLEADLIFSCPPYADLEVYSNNAADLSTMKYADFKKAYFEIIAKTCGLLKHNRFACFVVGEVRDKNGNYYNFVGDTIEAFRTAGLEFYNEAILVTPVGTVGMQTSRNFPIGRKLGKVHQNILVFVKGDGKKAAESCGIVEVDESMFEGIESAD